MKWKLIENKNDEPKWFPGETDPEGELVDNYIIRALDDKTGQPIPYYIWLYHTPRDQYPVDVIKTAKDLVRGGYRVEVMKEIAYSIKEKDDD